MNTTEKYGFLKPESTDFYNVEDFNENMEKVEEALNGKADTSHGNHVPDTCQIITDWNSATKNGWYMGSNTNNQPSAEYPWWFGRVTCHNENFLIQEAWGFTGAAIPTSNILKYNRVKMNGSWSNWVDDSPKSYSKKSSILSTIAECEASTNGTDYVGATVIPELKDEMYELQTSRINTEMFYGYLMPEDGSEKIPLYCQNLVVDSIFPNNQDVVIKTFNKVANFTVKDVRFFTSNAAICWFAGTYVAPSFTAEGDNLLLRIRQTVTGADVEATCHVFVVYSKLD